MRLAETITINVSGEAHELRPSLRAALVLYRKYDGFDRLHEAIGAGSVTAISDTIREGCGQQTEFTKCLDQLDYAPLALSLDALVAPLQRFVRMLAGHDDQTIAGEASGDPMPFDDYFTELFRIATGWLLWSPVIAWSATPAEIIEAQRGHIAMLTLIHGKKDDSDTIERDDDGKLPADARARLNALGDLGTVSMSQVP